MARLDRDTLGAVAAVVDGNQDEFVAAFHATLLRNPEAAPFLSHTIVDERLKHSLRKWLGRFPNRSGRVSARRETKQRRSSPDA